MLENDSTERRDGDVIIAYAAAVTVSLFGLLVYLNQNADDPEMVVAPQVQPIAVVKAPPVIPEPPRTKAKLDKAKVAERIPAVEPFAPDTPKFELVPVAGLIPVGTGIPSSNRIEFFRPENTFDPGDLDSRPEALQRIAPEYPYEMKRAGMDGWARIEFIVEEDGSVNEARVAAASDREFGEAARRAVRNWRFKPGMMDGQAVRTRMVQPFDFSTDR